MMELRPDVCCGIITPLVVPACFVLILLPLEGVLGNVRDAAIGFTGVPFALVDGLRPTLYARFSQPG